MHNKFDQDSRLVLMIAPGYISFSRIVKSKHRIGLVIQSFTKKSSLHIGKVVIANEIHFLLHYYPPIRKPQPPKLLRIFWHWVNSKLQVTYWAPSPIFQKVERKSREKISPLKCNIKPF